jgi:hypothetical protein
VGNPIVREISYHIQSISFNNRQQELRKVSSGASNSGCGYSIQEKKFLRALAVLPADDAFIDKDGKRVQRTRKKEMFSNKDPRNNLRPGSALD